MLGGGLGAVVLGADVVAGDGGFGDVVDAAGAVVVGASGNCWVSVGEVWPFRVAPSAIDVRALAAAATTHTPIPTARARVLPCFPLPGRPIIRSQAQTSRGGAAHEG